jgi:poly(A) polymerase
MNYKKQVNDLIKYSKLKELVKILKLSNSKIYFVGGATRSILSEEYNNTDIDIVVPNIEDDVIEDLNNQFDIKFFPSYRSLAISIGNFEYQINSFRKDIKSTGRHSKVAPAQTLEEDSERRDFTFNSVYINLEGDVFDFYSGVKDFQEQQLRFIFDPIDQIQQDYLRAIRYIRFLSLFKKTKTKSDDIDAILLLSKNIFDFVKEKKISQELGKIKDMPYPKNSVNFIEKHQELRDFLQLI